METLQAAEPVLDHSSHTGPLGPPFAGMVNLDFEVSRMYLSGAISDNWLDGPFEAQNQILAAREFSLLRGYTYVWPHHVRWG